MKEDTAIDMAIKKWEGILSENSMGSYEFAAVQKFVENDVIPFLTQLRNIEREQMIKTANALEFENVRKANIIFKRFGVESLCKVDEKAGLNYYNKIYGNNE